MPVFRVEKALSIARGLKAFLNLGHGAKRGAIPDAERCEDRAQNPKNIHVRRRASSQQMERIESKKREISQLKDGLRVAQDRTERSELFKRIKSKKQEIFWLKNELGTAKEPAAGDAEIGGLPDFVIIGAQKCGTTSLYHLLTGHPYVERATSKEPHYFDKLFDEGIEWYRRCFPQPKWKDGRKTVTGEATPGYIFNPQVPERMAEVVPHARLIALLRNPIDRAYSQYHQRVRKKREARSFKEAVEEERTWLLWSSEHGHSASVSDAPDEYLSRGIYVDQLLRWSSFFSNEQILVLKSEDFFARPQDTLERVVNFLGLPSWEPKSVEARKKGDYEREIDPATRRLLEDYFEPHNQRLYEYLDTDFGW